MIRTEDDVRQELRRVNSEIRKTKENLCTIDDLIWLGNLKACKEALEWVLRRRQNSRL